LDDKETVVSTSLKLKCEACGRGATLTLKQNVLDVLADSIRVTNPCPTCGGPLSCPGGYYRKNAQNMLTRIADFTPPTTALN
jgi:hypothetical protein